MPPRVTDQTRLEFRAGFGEGEEGRRGEHLFELVMDPRHAHVWRGIVGPGLPPWIGGLWIYQDDQLVSALPAREGGVPDQAPSHHEIAVLRSEGLRLQSYQQTLAQQIEVETARLRAVQTELARTELQLQTAHERHARSVAELDQALTRTQENCAREREQCYAELARVREETAAMRRDHVEQALGQRALLGQFQAHIQALSQGEFNRAQQIQERSLQAEQHATAHIRRVQDLPVLTGAATEPSAMEAMFSNFFNQLFGVLANPDVLNVILSRIAPPGAGVGRG